MIFFQEHSFSYVQMNFYNGIVFHLAFSNALWNFHLHVSQIVSYYSIPINDLVTEEYLQWRNILLL